MSKNGRERTWGHYSFSIRHGRLSANMNLGGGADGQISISQRGVFKYGAWNHLVMTCDGKSVRFYLNGDLQGSRPAARERVSGQGKLLVGQCGHGLHKVAKAVFDELRVWNRALSQEEVRAHATKPETLPEEMGLQYNETFDGYGAAEVFDPEWSDVVMRVRLKGGGKSWEAERKIEGTWSVGQKERLVLQCETGSEPTARKAVSVQVTAGGNGPYPVRFDPKYNCVVAEVRKINRNWTASSGNDIRDYDEFEVLVDNPGGKSVKLPFLLDLYRVASITGVCPILCDSDGVPTGVPVQLSKNWHYAKTGQYLRAFTQLPAPPGRSQYKLRIAYGFYGTLPSATHAQLSLVGYGGHGRWDQLAIGCWGETICFDMDMSLTDVAITDVRMLMTRNGPDGKKWTWTDAGWGGDWLNVKDDGGRKLLFSEMKTAYLSQGPCLTDTRYDGNYGSGREVEVRARVQTLRTDDFARTFQTLHYTFRKELSASGAWLFKMGRTGNSVSPRIAHGNALGPVLDEPVPSTLGDGDLYQDRVRMEGAAPWWIGFPGGFLTGKRAQGWGTGSRGWVIRSYRASFGGREHTVPSFSMPVYRTSGEGVNLDLLLTPPAGVEKFLPGDTVSMEIEWITFPRRADDYYGPNESFRRHLREHPESWRTIHREAAGNDLEVAVEGGTLLQ
ncbi:MAG: LamG domain-containing protein, partial [Coraliomargarita sp.]